MKSISSSTGGKLGNSVAVFEIGTDWEIMVVESCPSPFCCFGPSIGE